MLTIHSRQYGQQHRLSPEEMAQLDPEPKARRTCNRHHRIRDTAGRYTSNAVVYGIQHERIFRGCEWIGPLWVISYNGCDLCRPIGRKESRARAAGLA